jgi:hypothetical protein
MNAALGITDQGFSTDACRVPWADQTGPADAGRPGVRK